MGLQEEETGTQLQTNGHFQKMKVAGGPPELRPSNLARLTEAEAPVNIIVGALSALPQTIIHYLWVSLAHPRPAGARLLLPQSAIF